MRVRRPGVNQPKQLRESVISPNSNPGGRRAGETQEQVFWPSGRVSQPPGWLPSKSHMAAATRGPGIISGLTTSRGRQGLLIPASASQETAPGSPKGLHPHVSWVPHPPQSQFLTGDTRWPSLAQSIALSLRLGRAAPEPLGL